MPGRFPPEVDRLRSGGPTHWVVASHLSPDCDTLGSAIAMKQLLRAFGHTVIHLCPDPVPAAYRFLPLSDELVTELPADWPDGVSGLVTLDAADMGRFGRHRERLSRLAWIVDVDHHVSNPRFGHLNLVLTEAAATGEVVFHLFEHFGVPLDVEAATGIYVALVTDTGSFCYEATSAQTHEMAAALIRAGVRPGWISRQLFEQVPLPELTIKARALAELRLEAGGRMAWTLITREMLAQAGALEEHTEGLAERMRALAGVEVAYFLRETDEGTLKASLRSKEHVDVAALAQRFGGGGHRRAAGCTLAGPAPAAVEAMRQAVSEALRAGV